ncbi:MAG: hypothetical protein CMI67_25890 [Pelagibaca sp.]|nr:hypothetical protein [Pelagibaca sp.]
MGRVVRTVAKIAGVVALVATGAGAVFGAGALLAGASLGTIATVAGAVSLVAGTLGGSPKIPQSATQLGRLQATLNTQAPRTMILGDPTALAVDIRYYEGSGEDEEYVDYIIALAAHRIGGVSQIWFEDELAWSATGGVQGSYAGYLSNVTIRTEGTAANTIAINGGTRWGSDDRLTGCAYLRLRVKRTGNSDNEQSPLASGLPGRVTVIGSGMPMYDPRYDSTFGGSGTQRFDDQNSWGPSSNNPIIQALNVLIGWRINGKLSVGGGLPAKYLDLDSAITAANMCDEPIALAAGGTQPRYRTAGAFSTDDAPMNVVSALLAGCAGDLLDSEGRLSFLIKANTLATPSVTFDDHDVISGAQWDPMGGQTNLPNIISGSHVKPEALYQMAPYPSVSLASEDGIDRTAPVDFGVVENSPQSERLAKQTLQRMQYPGTFTAEYNMKGMAAKVGSIVWQSYSPRAWVNKPFRVVSQKPSRSGRIALVLREEHEDIYAWEANDSAPVQAAEAVGFDPRNSGPILLARKAAQTADWPKVTDSENTKPEDNATVGAPNGTPVGDRTADDVTDAIDRHETDISSNAANVAAANAAIAAAEQDIDDLIATYGSTASAAASADAAEQARQADEDAQAVVQAAEAVAIQARDDAQLAVTAAESARDDAQAEALAASGSAGVAAGHASTAITKADEAADSATAASGSATAAQSSAGQASVSEGNAATSATNAADSASSAATSATTAANARDDAEGHASAASSSETSAAASAGAAASSASSASTSANTATTKAGEASASAGQAATSASDAAGSATSASSFATLAAGFRDDAEDSADAAASSATTASTKAGEASTSASQAQSSAATATTKAGEASTSATNAANSATSASGSAATATTQAGVTATYASDAAKSATDTYPTDFARGAQYFKGDGGAQIPYRFDFVTTALGPVARTNDQSGYSYIAIKKPRPIKSGDVIRGRVRAKHHSGTPTNLYFRLEVYDDQNYGNRTYVNAGSVTVPAGGEPTWFEAKLTAPKSGFACLAIVANTGGVAIQELFALEYEEINSEEAAAASAIAAATSATTATAKAGEASTSASAAQASQTAAGNSATAAQASATTASQQAAAASSSATLSASYRDEAKARATEMMPTTFEADATFFTGDSSAQVPQNTEFVTESDVRVARNINTAAWGALTARHARPHNNSAWKIRARVRSESGTRAVTLRLCEFPQSTSRAPRTGFLPYDTTVGTSWTWIEHTFTGWAGQSKEFIAPEIILNYPTINGNVRCSALELIDMSGAYAAEAQAGIATSQAAVATAQAAAAQQSAILSASIGQGALNQNPGFDDYPSATVGALPGGYNARAGNASPYRVTDPLGGYAIRFPGIVGESNYIYSNGFKNQATISTNQWYVLEVDAIARVGTFAGAAYLMRAYRSNGTQFQDHKLELHATVPSPVYGRQYSFRKLVQVTEPDAISFEQYLFSHWVAASGGVGAVNDIEFRKALIRPATEQEIEVGTALPGMKADIATNASVLATQATTIASLQSTVSSHGSSITSYATAISGINGDLDALFAKAGVRIDVNGRITGWEANDDGSQGNFVIHADNFSIEKPGGGARTEYSNGNWRIYDASGNLRVRMGVW